VTGTILVDPYPRTLDQIFSSGSRTRLEALGNVVWHDGPPAPDALVEEALADAVAIVGQTTLPRDRVGRAPRLRAVMNVEGNFLPNVDYAACFARGIEVLCAAPVFGQPVAELALGLALACVRDIPRADRDLREGSESLYDDGRNEGAFLLAGKTLGLVGCGNLGRALLPLLRPYGGRLLVHDPWLAADELRALAVEPSGLVELFARSRVVFVVSAVTTENVGAVGRDCFDAMAPGGVVVLVSRAAVVDWEAMLDAAASGRLRIATDVFPEEPIPPGERARRTAGTVLSAHRAGNVPEIWRVMGEMVADDLEAILAGRPQRRLQAADPATVAMLRSRPIGQTQLPRG
jgi:phosphoglycerate dehydrogenase-like enzyme